MLISALNPYELALTSGVIKSDEAPLDAAALKQRLIKHVALSSLAELTLSLAITGTACLFVVTGGAATVILCSSSVFVLNTALRVANATCILAYFKGASQRQLSATQRARLNVIKDAFYISRFLPALIFTITSALSNVLVHEGGHALISFAVYKNVMPKITIFPDGSGVTRYIGITGLTAFGKWLGATHAMSLCAAGGVVAVMACVIAQTILAHKVIHQYPRLAAYLHTMSLFSIVDHVAYAYSALQADRKDLSHDFLYLWRKVGLHPYAAIILIMLVPIITQAALILRDQRRTPQRVAVA